jgi:hypothetical protein
LSARDTKRQPLCTMRRRQALSLPTWTAMAFGGKPKDRKWFIYASDDEFLRFTESGQP